MIARLLYALSGRLRCRIIGRETVYLERYFLFRVPDWVPGIGGAQGYLHRFLESDADPRPHDHPWQWAVTAILAGGYVEHRLAAFGAVGLAIEERVRRPGRVALIRGTTFHRVVLHGPEARPRPAWTLFIHGPYRKRWGFLAPSGARPALYDGPLWLLWCPHSEPAGGGVPWWRTVPRGRNEPRRVPLRGKEGARHG